MPGEHGEPCSLAGFPDVSWRANSTENVLSSAAGPAPPNHSSAMDTLSTTTPAPARRTHRWLRGLCAFAPIAATSAVFAASEPSLITGQKKSFGYSWQQELQLGAEADKDIVENMGIYEDQKVQQYVEAVGQRVLQQSNFNSPSAPAIYRDTKFTFRVMDSPVVNAFALPGGYVYVTRGLLTHVQNEAQLAVVLGHEIGHVAARHSSQQARRSQWTQLGVVAGAILGSKVLGERGADLAPSLINMGGQAAEMFLLRYGRDAENEADTLGMNYAMRSGYAADQSARFFESLKRLSAAEGKALPTWKSTHPDPGDRAEHVTKIAAAVPADTRTNVGEEEYLKHIEGMVIGDDPREGFARNGVFYHPTLRFQMPVAQGWKLDNQRAAVIFAEPNGKAVMGLKMAPGTRARDAAQQFTQNSKVQIVASGDTTINGLPATVIIGQGNTDEGAVGVWDAFIEYDGKVFSLLGYAPQNAFEQMRPTFESVAAGFSPLRDATVMSVQPSRVKLVRADRNSPFASFVPTALPEGLTADELAIMNQVGLNDQIQSGRILKIPAVPQNAGMNQGNTANTAYPNSSYPNSPNNYPNSYPSSSTNYPSNYPNNGYPQQQPSTSYPSNYPQTSSTNYPSTNYPNQSSTTYPSQPNQSYPSNYPNSSNYPATSYPNQYPSSQPNQYPNDSRTTYPNNGYPQQSYPSSSTSYPQQQQYPSQYPSQPSTTYPQQSTSPQFPQPPSSNRNQQPTYPR
jgi:predicted Zn-dependent protease